MLHQLVQFDRAAAEAVTDLRWPPLTTLMIALSEWWARGLLVLGALVADAARRRRVPLALLVTGVSMLLASGLGDLLKALVDRVRPAQAHIGITALVPIPSSASFPSGHAVSAFAAAGALAVLVPRLRVPGLLLAAAVAVSRVYLGVHYWSDVLAGAVLGLAVGCGLALLARQLAKRSARARPAASRSSTVQET